MPKESTLFSWKLSECQQRGATQLRIGRWFQGTWNAYAARFSDAGMKDAAVLTALKQWVEADALAASSDDTRAAFLQRLATWVDLERVRSPGFSGRMAES